MELVKAAAHVAHALRNLCSPCHTRSHILFLDHRPGTSHCWRMCTSHCIAAEAQAASHAPHALRNLCSLCRTRSHSTPFLDHRPGTSHYWRRCMCCSTMWSESTQAEAVFRPLRCQLESELSGDSAQAHQSRACERVSTVQYSSAASQLRRRLHRSGAQSVMTSRSGAQVAERIRTHVLRTDSTEAICGRPQERLPSTKRPRSIFGDALRTVLLQIRSRSASE